jgi:signal transduction histidine kinase
MQTETTSIIQAILFISAIFILVAVFVVAYALYFNRRKIKFIQEKDSLQREFENQLLHAQIEMQEATFQHIGKELHDNLGQLLSSTKMLLNVTEMNLTQVPDTLTTASSTLTLAIKELRMLARSLDKEWLQQFNFSENLDNQITRINASGQLHALFRCDTDIDMPSEKQVILFRIVQEAIQNAIKHGSPSFIDIHVFEQKNQLNVAITDDGIGIPKNFRGMGTDNMRQRTKLFQGKIEWTDNQPRGTVVNITIPNT